MPEVTFEALPNEARRSPRAPYNTRHRRVAAELRDRPGEWAHIGTAGTTGSATTLAYCIRTGRLAAYAPAGTFEAHARTLGGEPRVYARYVGPQQ